jgi:hypothetical protein
MLCQEPWIFEFEAFDGAWSLMDCADAADHDGAALCLARVIVARVVANAVRRRARGEDLDDDLACTQECLDGMHLPARDASIFRRLLGALRPFDAGDVVEELLSVCAAAARRGHEGSARGFAELAYETATASGLDEGAHGAALALARLAQLQEAPWTARKWNAIARVHARRFARGRFPVGATSAIVQSCQAPSAARSGSSSKGR